MRLYSLIQLHKTLHRDVTLHQQFHYFCACLSTSLPNASPPPFKYSAFICCCPFSAFQVLIFYHCPFYKQYPFLWPGKKIPAPWANTTSVQKLILFLETTLSERDPRGAFHVSQAILTPRVKTIARGLVGGLKNTLVHR